jgi:hypothetical protein
VRRLAEAFESELGHRVSVNLYLTPPGAQGFEAHYDWMDAFVLQVRGGGPPSRVSSHVRAPTAVPAGGGGSIERPLCVTTAATRACRPLAGFCDVVHRDFCVRITKVI